MARISSPIGILNSSNRGGRNSAPQDDSVDQNQNNQIQQSQQSISALSQSLETIRNQVLQLENTIKSLSGQLQQESAIEQKNFAQDQDFQRRSLERNVRSGSEATLEQKITNTLSAPIAAIQNKVANVFGNIMNALTTLFFGWLTNQGIETLKALTSGNKKKLEEIKWTVIKNVGAAIGIFAAMNFGFGFIIRSIGSLTRSVIGLTAKVVSSPFKALGSAISGLSGGGRGGGGGGGGRVRSSGGGGGGAKPSGGGVGGLLSKAFTAAGGIGDLMGGQFTDAALAGLTLKGPGIVKPIAGTLYAADTITEMFGGNLFGKNPNERETTRSTSSQSAAATPTPPTSSTGSTPSTPATPTPAAATPTPAAATPTPAAAAKPTPPAAPAATPTPAAQSQTSMFSSTFTAPELSRSSSAAQLENASTPPDISPDKSQSSTFEEDYSKYFTTPAKPEQIQPPPKTQQQIGSLPEQKPNVIIADGGNQTTQMSPPSKQPLTDVPFIPSSNPDNFYVLYSQLNYNVVM